MRTLLKDILHHTQKHLKIAFLHLISHIEGLSTKRYKFVDNLHYILSVILSFFVGDVDIVDFQEIELVILAIVYFWYFWFHLFRGISSAVLRILVHDVIKNLTGF